MIKSKMMSTFILKHIQIDRSRDSNDAANAALEL